VTAVPTQEYSQNSYTHARAHRDVCTGLNPRLF